MAPPLFLIHLLKGYFLFFLLPFPEFRFDFRKKFRSFQNIHTGSGKNFCAGPKCLMCFFCFSGFQLFFSMCRSSLRDKSGPDTAARNIIHYISKVCRARFFSWSGKLRSFKFLSIFHDQIV